MGTQQRLTRWISATQRVDAHLLLCEIYLRSNQTMTPNRRCLPRMAQEADHPSIIRTPQEDDHTSQRRLQVELPTLGKASACRCIIDARRQTLPACNHESLRLSDDFLQSFKVKPVPDLRLPAAVVIFDVLLEA